MFLSTFLKYLNIQQTESLYLYDLSAGSWRKSLQNLKRHLDNNHPTPQVTSSFVSPSFKVKVLTIKNKVIKNIFYTQDMEKIGNTF